MRKFMEAWHWFTTSLYTLKLEDENFALKAEVQRLRLELERVNLEFERTKAEHYRELPQQATARPPLRRRTWPEIRQQLESVTS